MTLAERIKELRGKLKQEEFAEKIGVHVSTLRSYEAGNIPKGDVLERIHVVTGASIDWLLFEKGEMYTAPRKTPDISTPLKPGTREEGGGYPWAEERLAAGGEPDRVYDPADPAVRHLAEANLELLKIINELLDENKQLRKSEQELWRRLAAKGEGRRSTDPPGEDEENIEASGGI